MTTVFPILGQAGIDPDPKEAATIFSELAKKGHPFAQVNFLFSQLVLCFE